MTGTAGRNQICRRGTGLQGRRALTLFEIVLALAIFIGALAAISQVLRTGSRAAIRAQLASEAVLRCERRMNEVLGGVLSLEAAQKVPFEDNSAWLWTLNILDSGTVNLFKLEMIVERPGTTGDNQASFRLVRFLRDPAAMTTTTSPTGSEVTF